MGFVDNYLTNRTFQIKTKCSDTFQQENGMVQGGVISPLLFFCMINDIFDGLPGNVSTAMYADDYT